MIPWNGVIARCDALMVLLAGIDIPDYDSVYREYRRVARRLTSTSRRIETLESIVAARIFNSGLSYVGLCPWSKGSGDFVVVRRGITIDKIVSTLFGLPSYRGGVESIIVGQRGSGKSTLQEAIALIALAGGAVVVDAYAAPGGEQLGWLAYVMGYDKRVRFFAHCFIEPNPFCVPLLAEYGAILPDDPKSLIAAVVWPFVKVLLVVPNTVDVEFYGLAKRAKELGIVDYMHLSTLLKNYTFDDIVREYNVVVFSVDAFNQPYAKPVIWDALQAFLSWLTTTPPSIRTVLLMRELATIAYVRGRLSERQAKVKALVQKIMREARHYNIALLADTQRIKGVESNVREIMDTIVFKRLNPITDVGEEILKTISTILYRRRDLTQEILMRMAQLDPNEFVALRDMCLVMGSFEKPPNHIGASSLNKIPIEFIPRPDAGSDEDLETDGDMDDALD